MLTKKQIDDFLADYKTICKKHRIVVSGYDDGPFLVKVDTTYNPLGGNLKWIKKNSSYKDADRT